MSTTGQHIDTALDLLLHEGRGTHDVAGKVYGVVPAVVTDIHDTDGPHRHKWGMIQVYFPWLQSKNDKHLISPWIRWSTPGAGKDQGQKASGLYCVPQVGDEVLVAFDQGDIHHPYALGSLWNGVNKIPTPVTDKDGTDCPGHHPGNPVHKTPDLTPECLGGDGGKNKIYFWRSRTGNLLIMNDKDGQVRILERTGNSVIQLEANDIRFLQKEGKGIFFWAQKMIRFDCTNFEVHTGESINMVADKNWTIVADRHIDMTSKGVFVSTTQKGTHCQAKKDVIITADKGMYFKSNLDTFIKASAEDMKVESGAKITVNAKAGDIALGTKDTMTFKSANGTDITSLMAINVIAQGNVNCKGSMIHMN